MNAEYKIINELKLAHKYLCESNVVSCLVELKNLIPSINSPDDLFSLLKETSELYNEKKIQLSVVINLSNVNKVNALIDTFLNQTLKKIEIILIDQGTRKLFSEKLEESFLNNDKIRLISLEKGSLNSQKDRILPYLNGEYVLYVNSHFEILPHFCEFIYLYSKIYNADSRRFLKKNKEEKQKKMPGILFELNEFIQVFKSYEISDYLPECLKDIATNLYRRKALFKYTNFADNFKNVCLVVIYNHNYEANIEKIEKIYKNRFHHIFHLMPFYTGQKENVIPVYQSSYHFCDYVRQGLSCFYSEEFSHYAFISDDVMINPSLNEKNIISTLLPTDGNACFSDYRPFEKRDILNWCFALRTVDAFLNNPGCLFQKFLPSYEKACCIMKGHGFPTEEISVDFVKKCLQKSYKEPTNNYIERVSEKDFKEIEKSSNNKEFLYPFAVGFSDFFVLPKEKIKEVCHMFGIFSAASVFTEVAIPTTLLLNFKKVYKARDLGLKMLIPSKNVDREERIYKKHAFDLDSLFNSFDEDLLLIHPVKLSQWKMKE